MLTQLDIDIPASHDLLAVAATALDHDGQYSQDELTTVLQRKIPTT